MLIMNKICLWGRGGEEMGRKVVASANYRCEKR